MLEAKRALQFATAGTFRGGLVTPTQRAVVEEAIVRVLLDYTAVAQYQFLKHGVQIDLEAYGRDIEYQQLEGLWRLIYTTALDVVCAFSCGRSLHRVYGNWQVMLCMYVCMYVYAVPFSCSYKCVVTNLGCPQETSSALALLQAPLVTPPSPFSPVRIGNIYQRFGSLASGLCQNIIKASVPYVLEEGMSTYATGCASDALTFLQLANLLCVHEALLTYDVQSVYFLAMTSIRLLLLVCVVMPPVVFVWQVME